MDSDDSERSSSVSIPEEEDTTHPIFRVKLSKSSLQLIL
jgi:hypothetical protein